MNVDNVIKKNINIRNGKNISLRVEDLDIVVDKNTIKLTLEGKKRYNIVINIRSINEKCKSSIGNLVTKELYDDFVKYDLVDLIEDLNNDSYTPSIDNNDIKDLSGKRVSYVFSGGYKKLKNEAFNDSMGTCGIVIVKTPYDELDEARKVLDIISSRFKGELQIASKHDGSLAKTNINVILFK